MKPKAEIEAHGAIHKVQLIEKHPKEFYDNFIQFGASCGDIDYPVQFVGLKNIKRLNVWINKVIKYLESEQEK